jgi:hypothetical protein
MKRKKKEKKKKEQEIEGKPNARPSEKIISSFSIMK